MTDSFHKDFDNIERALFQSHWELKTNLLLKKEAQDNVRPVEKQIRQYRQYIIWTRQTYGPLGGVIGHYHQRIEHIVRQYQELQTLYDQLLEVQNWEDLVDTKAELLAAIQKSNRQWEQDARKSAEVLLQDQTNRAGTCSSPDIDYITVVTQQQELLEQNYTQGKGSENNQRILGYHPRLTAEYRQGARDRRESIHANRR